MIYSLVDTTLPTIGFLSDMCPEPITICRGRAEAMDALTEADIVITSGASPLLDEEMIDAAKGLKLVLSTSAGVDRIPVDTLHRRGIPLCNTRGAHAVSIAEYVLGAMLCVSYRLPLFIRNQDKALWQNVYGIEGLEGKTLCIIGAGSIGSVIGKKAGALGMRVVGLKRSVQPLEGFDQVLPITALYETLEEADFVVLITPLTPETYHLMDSEAFSRMKPSAVFINVSRGDTVDEAALIRALKERTIAGAILDVFHTEPLPKDSPLWTMPNVLVTPHNSAITQDACQKSAAILCENIRRFRRGDALLNVIEGGKAY
ncbi:MAG TPA: D-2-hydroxyacid dehydrogenase [Papillibacter sp.]|nr:D-2-hydroxyacid dehydrogenase [Papillibacter sp.]